MTKYAEHTSVSVEKSRGEIQKELVRYGVKEYGTGISPRGTGVIFKWQDHVYKLNVTEPDPKKFSSQRGYDQARRTRWRILLLLIKAKLNAVQDGDTTMEDEFLSRMALPDGRANLPGLRISNSITAARAVPIPIAL